VPGHQAGLPGSQGQESPVYSRLEALEVGLRRLLCGVQAITAKLLSRFRFLAVEGRGGEVIQNHITMPMVGGLVMRVEPRSEADGSDDTDASTAATAGQ
jgi:hypothetical protein